MTYYSREDIKRELKSNLERCKIIDDLWGQVELVTKKDGKPFKKLEKNFTNAYFSNEFGVKKIEVYKYDRFAGRVDDWVNINNEDNPKKIMDKIIERRKANGKHIQEYENTLKELDLFLDKWELKFKELGCELREDAPKNSSVNYGIFNYLVRNCLKYNGE